MASESIASSILMPAAGKKNSLVRGPIIYKQVTMNLLLVTVSIELAKYYHLDQIFGQLPEKRYTIEILGIF
jgi:hypothetical protein